jgi:L-alanine-DL-glutamate epimerase-like enolase superfamily enzyme
VGRGEAAGIYYRPGEDVHSGALKIAAVRSEIEAGVSRADLQRLLPAGTARNAVDCALWDLDAQRTGRSAWELADLERPRPLLTTMTVSANTPEKMAAAARAYSAAKAIKLKLTGEPSDSDRVRAVRETRPDVWLGVDANQGFTLASLAGLMPTLVEARVQLIEQPFKMGQEELLEGLRAPIPVAADESVQGLADVPGLVGRFQVMNIKLDKCGGLTEALAMAREARRLGLAVMVGNMLGTSLGMAPAWLVGQVCEVVDLDGPVFLQEDRSPPVRYHGGLIHCPDGLWGVPR